MRNIRITLTLILASILFWTPSTAQAEDNSEDRKPVHVFESSLNQVQNTWKKTKITVTPTIDYWEKVAVCETNSDWKNGGTWAGGLGIYTKGKFGSSSMGTWEYYGGEEFAPSPDKATKDEQIKVANRIAVLGYRTTVYRDPIVAKKRGIPAVYKYYKEPVGFSGWGCVKSKSTGKWRIGLPKKWSKHLYVKLPTNPHMYCKNWEHLFKDEQLPVKLFSYIAWRESRCQADVIGWNFKSGMSKSDCQIMSVVCEAVSTYDSGLLQINSTWKTVTSQVCASPRGNLSVLKDPVCNVKVARYLYERGPKRFSHWNIKVYPA